MGGVVKRSLSTILDRAGVTETGSKSPGAAGIATFATGCNTAGCITERL